MRIIFIIVFLYFVIFNAGGQTRQELEERRQKTLEEIAYVDNLIKETSRQKTSGLNDLRIIGSRLALRENIIDGLREEIDLLTDRINLNTLAVDLMEKDLTILKDEYAKTIINSYKSIRRYPEMGFILSAKDINQGYKRLKYLQQAAKFRRREVEIINELKKQIEDSKKLMEADLVNVSELKIKEENQKSLLQKEQERKRGLVSSLSKKEKQLQQDLQDKKRIAKQIENEILRLIEEEKRKSVSKDLTPEMRLIGENFTENKGRLPWPVEKGIITSEFGIQKHPDLTFVTEDNPGIEITSSGKTPVRSVFKGEVARVFAISGANMAVIIRHGKYFSVYQNLINVKVKPGDIVDTKQEIGEVFFDPKSGSRAILKFMIFNEKNKVNPRLWLAKKN
jgi:septal ring factor EnvC (AmiA/AmiB activator)